MSQDNEDTLSISERVDWINAQLAAGKSRRQLATALGISVRFVAVTSRMRELDPEVLHLLDRGEVSIIAVCELFPPATWGTPASATEQQEFVTWWRSLPCVPGSDRRLAIRRYLQERQKASGVLREDSHAAYQRKATQVDAALRRNGCARPHYEAMMRAIQEDTGMEHDEAFRFIARWFTQNLG